MKLIPILSIICITGLEALALCMGHDGYAFGIAVAAISGLGGYEVKVIRDKIKGGKQ